MNTLEIVEDPSDACDADVVVCVLLTQPLLLPDNVIDLCSMCGEAIQHRPHIPKGPALVCYPCIEPRLKSEMSKGELVAMITPKTATEFREFLRKKQAN